MCEQWAEGTSRKQNTLPCMYHRYVREWSNHEYNVAKTIMSSIEPDKRMLLERRRKVSMTYVTEGVDVLTG
jgi:hypothetical protein